MPNQTPIPLPHVHDRLSTVSAALGRRYAAVAPTLQVQLTSDELMTWAGYCEQLAQSGWRAWESAEAFCHLSPSLLQHLDVTALWHWADEGRGLARQSADVATAFFRAARAVAWGWPREMVQAWTAGGQWYLQHYPAQPSLAVAYFQISPDIYQRFSRSTSDRWTQLGQALAPAGVTQTRVFFDLSRLLIDREDELDPAVAWELAHRLAAVSTELALQALERYPELLQRFGKDLVVVIDEIVLTLFETDRTQASTFLRVISGTFTLLPAADRRQALEWCQEVVAVNPAAALDFLQQLPELVRSLSGERLQEWISTGLGIAAQNESAGQAYFALESVTAHERLRVLQGQVSFTIAQRVLQLYTEGFAGRKMALRTTEALSNGVQRGERDLPTSDGTTLFVPSQVTTFDQARDNFAVYKVAILHQLGFYDCGTFTFRIEDCLRCLPQIPQLIGLEDDSAEASLQPAFTRFFAAFEQPELARQLFTILEDARIDAILSRRYKGLRQDLTRLMGHSLAQRPMIWELSLRQALLEGILQFTLGATLSPSVPPGLQLLLERLLHPVMAVQAATATVYDTALAVATCYYLITRIPDNVLSEMSPEAVAQLQAMADGLADDADAIALADMFQQAGDGADAMPVMPDSSEPADGMEPVPYRGDMKPELVQKKMQVQDLAEELDQLQEALSPLTAEQLRELLENGELNITSLEEGDLSASSGLFMSDLEGREAQKLKAVLERLEALKKEIDELAEELDDDWGEIAPEDAAFRYDEWDYLIQDYRREWCYLTETVLAEGSPDFVHETRRKYADLLTMIRRQFQLLKPEMFKKMKRLIDGEEIDIDSVIEAMVDRRAGNTMSEKVYMSRVKRDREVAAVFLLDMSASTDDGVPETLEGSDAEVREPDIRPRRQYDFSGFIMEDFDVQGPMKSGHEPTRRRIIDVEKEALVLMAEALETLGDAYAVYGFSGYGRDQVDFFVAKEFSDVYDERTQARIASIKPHRSTRMGPAIRHAVRKLEGQEARIKTLLILSDGYPQDYDYGKDRKSKDYGIQDTMMALREAQLKGIQTFCITVDPSGHDYLRAMCPDQQYLIIEDIKSLPDELPKVYRGLTT